MKIDCSITDNYLKEKRRMIEITTGCKFNDTYSTKDDLKNVQSWSDAHQQKTYLDDLLEKYPNCKLNNHGVPFGCINNFGIKEIICKSNCVICWNQTMEEYNA